MPVVTRLIAPLFAPADDHGMSTAEYALCTVSAVAFAGVLYAILTSETVNEVLTALVVDALGSGV
ncbi:DUF4244 domain-containing protein [Nocardiopsis sp. CNR-923]|uniref:DUF4244 domain-containing protein n=1 Tax=Nocardiopsis sp. CNR-923 TaxID=1904965 RepID=UPI00096368FF|nr:DUF4244 domain-containing protein [Nocardiopsis sp. CNR-923]OLT29460.1 DUF4244 domain-containing protein [Nocardiopsis sp. CNR-923]